MRTKRKGLDSMNRKEEGDQRPPPKLVEIRGTGDTLKRTVF